MQAGISDEPWEPHLTWEGQDKVYSMILSIFFKIINFVFILTLNVFWSDTANT